MASKIIGVRCTPVKGLGATYTTADRCVLLLLLYVGVAAAAAVLLLLFLPLLRLKGICVNRGWRAVRISIPLVAGYLRKNKKRKCAVFHVPYSARRGGKQYLVYSSQFSDV